ncbi:MAG: exodeoxyribonuclease VII large subunit [Candidatus Eisenbacteria bacterium]|nr:exodeoxyribonuclease VII large subunit [Candidatus Eisenbacteria bacterium]
MTINPSTDSVLTVSALSRLVKDALEGEFPAVWVKGELSGFTRSDRGHLYFSLKEGRDATLDCVVWKGAAGRLSFEPRDGTEIEAFGRVSSFPARSRYQLIVEELRPGGLGALLLALEELKRRLAAEGLFDEKRKRPLPSYPRRIGVVTSPIGAAVRDIIKVLRARWPSIEIVLAPVNVQGRGAAEEIAAAIERFNRWGGADLLIVGRGGGSLEDLWAFNEEIVVRAVATSGIPVISAVGHEVDWTLTDSAADVRAATPSNAAELAVRERAEVARRIESLAARASRALRLALEGRRQRLGRLAEKYGFRRVRDFFGLTQQRVDDARERLIRALRLTLDSARDLLAAVRRRYGLREWPRVLTSHRDRVDRMSGAATEALVRSLQARRVRLTGSRDRLRALSPRRVLERGYCLARRRDGTLLRAAEAVRVGETITVEFARGEADARIEAVRPGGN